MGGDARVETPEAACSIAMARVSASRDFPASIIAYCDTLPADGRPNDLYVLALHSKRECEGICSTNMGWFAAQKAPGRVFGWDVAEGKIGSPIMPTP